MDTTLHIHRATSTSSHSRISAKKDNDAKCLMDACSKTMTTMPHSMLSTTNRSRTSALKDDSLIPLTSSNSCIKSHLYPQNLPNPCHSQGQIRGWSSGILGPPVVMREHNSVIPALGHVKDMRSVASPTIVGPAVHATSRTNSAFCTRPVDNALSRCSRSPSSPGFSADDEVASFIRRHSD